LRRHTDQVMLGIVTERPLPGPGQGDPPRAEPIPGDPVSVEEIVTELRLLRERGLVRIRHTELATLRLAAGQAVIVPADVTGPRAIETLLRAAVGQLGDGPLAAAAGYTFGLNRGGRDRAAQDRRRRAAQEYGVSVERFRKYHERIVMEQVAEAILELCQPAGPVARAVAPAELAAATHLECRLGGSHFRVVVHVQPVELLRDVDVVIAPSNTYLEPPQVYKASVSASLRRTAAERGADGTVVGDTIAAELRSWLAAHARPGLPVDAGTVVATSGGTLAGQGIRRIYHAAIASPRPGTNDYHVEPASITRAVHAIFATARSERGLFQPPLSSLGFPLLGAGRGGLAAATSFTWMWAAMEHEMRADSSWLIHFITRRRSTADAIISGLGGHSSV
jgi:hypothetical protein